MRTKSAFWVFLVCLAAPVSSIAQTTYFSVGDEIRQLGSTQPVYKALGTFIGDLALCSDGYLYFVQKSPLNVISRINSASPTPSAEDVFAASGVREIRLTKDCDVVFATQTKIAQVNGRPPFSSSATTLANVTNGSGLAIAFDGGIRFTDAINVVGNNVANGGADGSLIPQLPIGAICRSELNQIICTDSAGQPLGPLAAGLGNGVLAQLPAVDLFQFCEFYTNNTLVCAASVDPEAQIKLDKKAGLVHNGTVQLISAAGVVTQVFEASTKMNVALPIAGIAVGPSSSELVTTASGTTHVADFGVVTVNIFTPTACRLNITLRQLTLAETLAKVNSASGVNTYLPDPGKGSESFFDNVIVTIASGQCGLSPATPATFAMHQFVDMTKNRAVLHCSGNICEADTHSSFPFWDEWDTAERTGSSQPDVFSNFLTAIIVSVDNPVLFSTPLDNRAVILGLIDDEIQYATTHTGSGGLSVRFKLCKPGTNCTEFLPGVPPDPPDSGAGFAVSVVDLVTVGGQPIFKAVANCTLDDNGGANPDRPVFRIADDGFTHVFNVNTPLGGPPVCQLADLKKGESRLFVGTVFFHNGGGLKTSILFRLEK